MFKARKHGREKLFERAMLARKEKVVRRRMAPGETAPLPWVSVSLWAAFSLVGGYVLFFSPALMIQKVSVEGASVIPLIEYQALAETELEGAYLGVVSRRNFFFAPTGRITERVLERYPKLSAATVSRHFPDSLTLSLEEAPVILRWCSGGPCYGIRDGRAAVIPFSEDERYESVRLSVIDASALPVQIGAVLPVETYLESFRVARDGLERIIAGPVSAVASTPSRHSNELALSTGEGWRLLIAVHRPAEESLGTLRIFLDEYAKEHADRTRLESVDLRVEGKVFYAESGQPVSESVSPDPSTAAPETVDTKKKEKKKSDR